MDFAILLSYFKKKSGGLTRFTKAFQIFTAFNKFKYLQHVNPHIFGGEDAVLAAQIIRFDGIIFNIQEEFYMEGETEKFKKQIELRPDYREKLEKKMSTLKLVEGQEDVIILIKALAYITDNYSLPEFIRLCYTLFPETIDKSTIKNEIFRLNDNTFRKIFIDLIQQLSPKLSNELIRAKWDILVAYSLVKEDYQEHIRQIGYSILNESLIKNIMDTIRKPMIKLLDELNDDSIVKYLRIILDVFIENIDNSINDKVRFEVIKKIMCFSIPDPSQIKNFYDIFKENGLSTTVDYL
ncbi:MAG: hypothetical protein ACTSWN_01505 [Promethearchaeota archaeon]